MKPNEFPTAEQFKSALAPITPEFRQETRELLQSLRDEREEKRVKKKFVFSLVLAIVLVLFTSATALALTVWREDLGQLLNMESSSGYYDEWELEEKLLLLDMMEKNSVDMDQKKVSIARDKNQPEQERNAAADAIIGSRYGINDRIDTVTALGIMETEMGLDFFHWSIEDMAWYSQMELKYKNASSDAEVFTLPKEGELTQEEALARAKEVLKEIRGVDVDQTPYTDTQVQYVVYPYMAPPMNEPEWRFSWLYEDGSGETVCLSPKGEINDVYNSDFVSKEEIWYNAMQARRAEIEERVGPSNKWGFAEWAYVEPVRFREPTAEDITPEEAIALAKAALVKEEGMEMEALDAMEISINLALAYVTPEGKWQYTYSVSFASDEPSRLGYDCYARIFSDTGDVYTTYRFN